MLSLKNQITTLVKARELRISEHGYDELSADNLQIDEIIHGIETALVIEEYPEYPKGPAILLLQKDQFEKPVHVVWGIPKGYNTSAVLVTAYRPDKDRWDSSFTKRILS